MPRKMDDPPPEAVRKKDADDESRPGPTKGETAYTRALRNSWILEQAALGFEQAEIAARVGVSQSVVSGVVRQFRDSGIELRLSKPPQQLVEEHLTAQFRSIETHLGLAAAAAEGGDYRLAFSHVAQ